MKTKEEEFYAVMEEVIASDYFNVNDADILEKWQDKALEEYGGFLALVSREDYPQVAFDVLNAIYTFNLSQNEQQYRIATISATRDELRPIENDIKLAKQYRESVNLEALTKLVDLNIHELEQYLERRITEAKRKPDKIIEAPPSITSFDPYKYETGSRKFLKKDIEATLNRIVKQYNLLGHSKSIKKLISSL